MGLVEGYELMNLNLAQPQLRAGLEVDLKAICEGTKSAEVVLREQIEIYRECYRKITQQVQQLDLAIGNRFNVQPAANAEANLPALAISHELFKCPKCRINSMVVKQKKDNAGSFISCQGYPNCKHVIWLQSNVKSIVSVDEKCTACGGDNHKVEIKFAQAYMLGMVDEVPAYSKINGNVYTTCLYCDSKAREVLHIKPDDVKVLGNVVSAGSRPIVQNAPQNSNPTLRNLYNNNNNNNNNNNTSGTSNGYQSRGFSSSASNDTRPSQIQRRGWFNNDDNDDDDRPSGSGAVAISNGTSNSRNYGNTSSGFGSNSINDSRSSQIQRRGWFNDDDNRSSSNGNLPTNNGGSNNGMWDKAKRNQQLLNTLPNIDCNCSKKALKLVCKKEGPNINRPFYKCNKNACKFFQWADVPLPPNLQNQQPRGNNASASSSANGNSSGQRKCGNCRLPGHTKKNCPNSG
jgi:DNA topoisomerase-3